MRDLIENKNLIQVALVYLNILAVFFFFKYDADKNNAEIQLLAKNLFFVLLAILIIVRILIKHTLYESHFKNKIKAVFFILSSLISSLIFGVWLYSFLNIWHYWKDHDPIDNEYNFLSILFWGGLLALVAYRFWILHVSDKLKTDAK